ncbi:hypothetical protein K438DRAFT_1998556 [Mycena galopus ATCC 62051]|nr:hypothetical protein K438DRAFT_1998556 [Mycena galopus ATCC 62051]
MRFFFALVAFAPALSVYAGRIMVQVSSLISSQDQGRLSTVATQQSGGIVNTATSAGASILSKATSVLPSAVSNPTSIGASFLSEATSVAPSIVGDVTSAAASAFMQLHLLLRVLSAKLRVQWVPSQVMLRNCSVLASAPSQGHYHSLPSPWLPSFCCDSNRTAVKHHYSSDDIGIPLGKMPLGPSWT